MLEAITWQWIALLTSHHTYEHAEKVALCLPLMKYGPIETDGLHPL